MKRVLLAIVLVFLLSLSVPALRSRAMPKYRALGAWTWGHLEGPMSPALAPFRRWRTQEEMAKIANQLILFRNRGQQPPRGQDLVPFIRQATDDSTATDAWGSQYSLRETGDSVYVHSPGPDMEPGTEDDLEIAIRYRTNPRRSRR